MVCVGKKAEFPETKESCESFRSAGVELERSWQTADGDRVVNMTDVWRSTDGEAHSLDVLYTQEFGDETTHGGAFEFPGKAGFAETKAGEAVTLPGGAGTLFYKSDATTPAGGDLAHPQGAVAYDSAPSEALSVMGGSKAVSGFNGVLMPYKRNVPAGGTTSLRMTFITANALSEVHSLAEAALASYPPSIAITSPPGGSTVGTPSVTVTGTASDTGGVASVTVNGVAATLAARGHVVGDGAARRGGQHHHRHRHRPGRARDERRLERDVRPARPAARYGRAHGGERAHRARFAVRVDLGGGRQGHRHAGVHRERGCCLPRGIAPDEQRAPERPQDHGRVRPHEGAHAREHVGCDPRGHKGEGDAQAERRRPRAARALQEAPRDAHRLRGREQAVLAEAHDRACEETPPLSGSAPRESAAPSRGCRLPRARRRSPME